jgi:isoleucyl-tRNA synthetase
MNVLEYWREIDAFKTSQKLSEGKPEYSFYDGPPFATGKPHYGHLLAGTIKVSSQNQSFGTMLVDLS